MDATLRAALFLGFVVALGLTYAIIRLALGAKEPPWLER
jgi:hypothetical protein